MMCLRPVLARLCDVLCASHQLLCTAAVAAPHAVRVHLLKQQKALEVTFQDGKTFRYPAELLRAESPSAQKRRKVVAGRRYVGLLGAEPVGNYAVRLQFDDLHSTGIYSWPLLYELGVHKYSRMRSYVKALRELGLTREPPGRKKPEDNKKGIKGRSKDTSKYDRWRPIFIRDWQKLPS